METENNLPTSHNHLVHALVRRQICCRLAGKYHNGPVFQEKTLQIFGGFVHSPPGLCLQGPLAANGLLLLSHYATIEIPQLENVELTRNTILNSEENSTEKSRCKIVKICAQLFCQPINQNSAFIFIIRLSHN